MKTPIQLATEYFSNLEPPRQYSCTAIIDAYVAGYQKAVDNQTAIREKEDREITPQEKAEEAYQNILMTQRINKKLKEMGLGLSLEDFKKLIEKEDLET